VRDSAQRHESLAAAKTSPSHLVGAAGTWDLDGKRGVKFTGGASLTRCERDVDVLVTEAGLDAVGSQQGSQCGPFLMEMSCKLAASKDGSKFLRVSGKNK